MKVSEKGWKITYTNVKGLIEVNASLSENNPDIMELVETKLCNQEVHKIGDGDNSLWQRNKYGKEKPSKFSAG